MIKQLIFFGLIDKVRQII